MTDPTTSDEIREFVTTVAATVRAGMSITEIMELFNDMLLALEGAADTIDALTAQIDAAETTISDLRYEVADLRQRSEHGLDAATAPVASDEGGYQCATCGVRWDSRYDGQRCPRCGWVPGQPIKTDSDWYVAPGTPLVLELTNGQKRPMMPASAPSAATAIRPIPVLSADEAELLDDMLAYDPHYERTEKRELKKHQMLVELEKQGLVFWYKNPGEDKAWTLSSWGRSVAAHYNVADDGSDDPTPQPPVASTAASAAPAKLTTKLTASNSIVLRNIKRMFNGRIFKAASIILNSEGEQAAIEMILTHYVREDRRDSMRAALQEAHHD